MKIITYNIYTNERREYQASMNRKDFDEAIKRLNIQGLTFDELCDIMAGEAPDRHIEYDIVYYSANLGKDIKRGERSVRDFFGDLIKDSAWDFPINVEIRDIDEAVKIEDLPDRWEAVAGPWVKDE